MPRLSTDERMMKAAWLAANDSSTCLSRKCGCVAARGNRILLVGYNGAPQGEPHCDVVGCQRLNSKPGHDLHKCRGLHAEAAIITIAADEGISLKGVTFYCTHKPCNMCQTLIANIRDVGVKYDLYYPDPNVNEVPRSIVVERLE